MTGVCRIGNLGCVPMNRDEIGAVLDNVFDQALVFHGFTSYMRDYEMVIQASSDPRLGLAPQYLRYVFVNCVQANISSALSPQTWAVSLDERLIDYKTGVDLEGYVWGVEWQQLYPGFQIVDDSDVASSWSSSVGLPFYEAHVRTNGHNLEIVFSDLRILAAPSDYAPFTVGAPFWDGKIPL